jgi:hypothetical protein
MIGKSYSARALTAYYRRMARHTRTALPIDALPTRIVETIMAEKAYIIMRNASRTLAIYRVRPDGGLRWLKRWPRALTE